MLHVQAQGTKTMKYHYEIRANRDLTRVGEAKKKEQLEPMILGLVRESLQTGNTDIHITIKKGRLHK